MALEITDNIRLKILERFPNADFTKGKFGVSKTQNPTLYENVRSLVRSLTGQRSAYFAQPEVKLRTRELQRGYYADPEKRKKILEKNRRNITKPEQAIKRKKYLQDKYYYGGQREKDLARLKGVTISKNLGGYLQNSDNVLFKDMIRAAEQGDSNLKLIRGGPNNTVVAIEEGNKTYHAVGAKRLPVEGAPKNSISIIKHPSFKKRFEFVKQQKAFKNTKVPNKNITYGQALDVLESKKAGTPLQNKNPAEFEHVKGVATDYKKGQIALRTANREKQKIMAALTNGHITKVEADKSLKKIGVRDFYKGKYIGAPKIDSSKQFTDLKKYVDRMINKDSDLIKATKVSDLSNIEGVTTADKIPVPEKTKTMDMFKNAFKTVGKAKTAIPAAALTAFATSSKADDPTYNSEIGAIVKPGTDEIESQSSLLDWTAANPEPLIAASAIGGAGLTTAGNTMLKGLLKTLAAPAAGVANAAYEISENLEGGDNILEAVADKTAGLGLMGSSSFSKGLGSLLGGAKLARSLTPVGAAMTAAGLGKDYYDFASDEIEKMDAMSDYDRKIYNDMLMDETNIDF